MDIEFHNIEELRRRLSPALRCKKREFDRLGLKYIKEIDIWKYLSDFKWKNGHNLYLSDLVNDILKCDSNKINSYVMEKLEKKRNYIEDLEII